MGARALPAGALGRATAGRFAGRLSVPTLTVAGLTLLALALRLAMIRQSLYGDELWTYFEIVPQQGLGGVISAVSNVQAEQTPPLYFLLAWISSRIADPTVWIRVPSLVASAATVPVIYLVGTRTVSRRAALLAAALFTLSPFALYYGVEARAYALAGLLVALSILALLEALRTSRPGWWIALAISLAATLYTHYTAACPVAAAGVWAFVAHAGQRRWLCIAYAAAVLAFVPWMPTLVGSPPQIFPGLYATLTPSTFLAALEHAAVGTPFSALAHVPGMVALVLIAAAPALVFGGMTVGLRQARATGRARRFPGGFPRPRREMVLLAIVAAASPLAVLLYSSIDVSILLAREFYVSLPALALLASSAVADAPSGRVLSAAASVLLLGGFLIGAVNAVQPSAKRPNYQDAARFIERTGTSADPVVVFDFPDTPGRALEVALHGPRNILLNPTTDQVAQAVGMSGGRRLFVVFPNVPDVFSLFPQASTFASPSFALPLVHFPLSVSQTRTFPGLSPLEVRVFPLRNQAG